jgi:hypothetical protein
MPSLSLPFGYTLQAPGSGEYPTNYSTYSVAYSHANLISSLQLMWCNGGFTSGQYSTVSSDNPYIDYAPYYGQTVDYSSFNTSGVTKSRQYTAANDDWYQGGNKTVSGVYKWVMLSDVRQSSSSFGRVVVSGTGGTGSGSTLVLGDDYLLYVQEIESYFSPGITIPWGYASGRSGWKSVQGTWDSGLTVQLNNADDAGAYRRFTNSGQQAVHNIKFFSPNANTTVFYRIGLKNGSNVKITNVVISYGTS